MTTGNRSQKMKFLGVELLKKDATKNSKPEVGLFRGIRTRSEGQGEDTKTITLLLIGVKDKENDLKGLNMDVFNVLSMKMMYGDTKELVVFKANDADQEQAMEMLTSSLEEFQKEKRMVDNDPEIIDVKTYEDVPTEFFAPKKTTTTVGNGYGYGAYNDNCGYNNTEWKKKEEERKAQKAKEEKMRWTPTMIKRDGELPGLKVLNAIKKKVLAIAGGEYENTLVDPDPDDTFGDGEKKSTAVG